MKKLFCEHFTSDEFGMETTALIKLEDHWADVFFIQKSDDGEYFYGFIDGTFRSAANKENLIQFLYDNSDCGWSVGSFSSVDEVRESMEEDDTIPTYISSAEFDTYFKTALNYPDC